MKCYHCGQENNDEAVFCKQCGQRVDGKIQCPTCNQLIDYDSQFCEYCGNSLQEELQDTDETTATESHIENTEHTFINTLISQKFKLKGKRIFEIGSGAFAMLSVFFSLLFTFFIGLKPNGSNLNVLDNNLANTLDLNIFYYLGECYSNTLVADKNYPPFFVSNYYFTTIMGTLLSIAIITTVVIF